MGKLLNITEPQGFFFFTYSFISHQFIQHLFSTYISRSLCNFWQGAGTQISTEAKKKERRERREDFGQDLERQRYFAQAEVEDREGNNGKHMETTNVNSILLKNQSTNEEIREKSESTLRQLEIKTQLPKIYGMQ